MIDKNEFALRACFRVSPSGTAGEEDGLPEILGRELRRRFEATRWPMIRVFWLWMLLLKTERGALPIMFWRSKFVVDNWILEITPLRPQTIFGRLLFASNLSSRAPMQFGCSELHTVLTGIPSVTDIRWYFQSRECQSVAVATPEELRWPEDIGGSE